jgi:hypothetical protein
MRRVLSGTTVGGDIVSEGEEAELGVGGLVQRPRPDARPVLIGVQLLAARTPGAHLQYDPGRFISVWGDKRTRCSSKLISISGVEPRWQRSTLGRVTPTE